MPNYAEEVSPIDFSKSHYLDMIRWSYTGEIKTNTRFYYSGDALTEQRAVKLIRYMESISFMVNLIPSTLDENNVLVHEGNGRFLWLIRKRVNAQKAEDEYWNAIIGIGPAIDTHETTSFGYLDTHVFSSDTLTSLAYS